MHTTTAPAAQSVVVRRGRGTKVHAALILKGKVVGTFCVQNANMGSRMDSRLSVTEGPVTCVACGAERRTQQAPKAAPAPQASPEAIADRSARLKARTALMDEAIAANRAGNREEALRLMAEAEAISTAL